MRVALFLTNVLTNVTIIPAVSILFKRRSYFDAYVSTFGMLMSSMYHLSEALGSPLILTELQWHRLDNIGALLCFAVFFIYLCNIRNPALNATVKFLSTLLVLICQEKAPWEEVYTIVPFLLFALLPLMAPLIGVSRPSYDRGNFQRGFSLLGLGVIFFVIGLDDRNDPGRVFHGTWHMLAGSASYWLWRIVVPTTVAVSTHVEGLV